VLVGMVMPQTEPRYRPAPGTPLTPISPIPHQTHRACIFTQTG